MIDSHSHIYTKPYREDVAAVIQRARDAGITQLLQVGCNLEDSHAALALANEYAGIYASVGIHPHDADSASPQVLAEVKRLTQEKKVIAFGEIGLDFYYDNSPRQDQIRAFEAQMDLVADTCLPVVIHTRDAEPETLAVLSAKPAPRGGHVHCYTGTLPTAERLLALGYHIGFTGIITFKSAEELRQVVAHTPLERILIETDSPYLAPIPFRGKRNEPAYVRHVAEKIAEVKGLSLQEVIRVTSENFRRLYQKPGLEWETL